MNKHICWKQCLQFFCGIICCACNPFFFFQLQILELTGENAINIQTVSLLQAPCCNRRRSIKRIGWSWGFTTHFTGVARVMLHGRTSRVPWAEAIIGWSASGSSWSIFFFHCWLSSICFFTPQLPHDVNSSAEDGGNWNIRFKTTLLIQIKMLTQTYQAC